MGNLNGFDANNVEPNQQDFSPLPAGEYKVMVVNSDVAPVKSGNGEALKLELMVCEGEYENRRLFANLNIIHSSQQAQQIGQGQLSALCHAIGKLKVDDSNELHDIPFIAKVAVKNDQTYGPQNEVKAFKSINSGGGGASAGAPTGQPSAPSAPQQTATGATAGQGKRPWER